MKLIHPPRLHPGDRVSVVAASGPVSKERFEAGAQALGNRYRLSYDETTLFARTGFLAGNDSQRAQALNTAIADPDCKAIFLARGGYGLLRIMPAVDLQTFRAQPKPIVGYSDVTALLSACAHAGVTSIHGPMISEYADLSEPDRDSLLGLLEDPDPGILLTDLEGLIDGQASGPLLGGNLETLTRLLGTPLQPDCEGAVLFLEEVGELPYRIDRLLTHLELAGVFDSVVGIVVGDFIDCDEIKNGQIQSPTAREVLEERLGRLSIPVALGGSFGHGEHKASLPYAAPVELDTESGSLRAIEGAVS